MASLPSHPRPAGSRRRRRTDFPSSSEPTPLGSTVRLKAAALAASILLLSPATGVSGLSPAQQFQLALEAQSGGDYARMLATLREAASARHLPAQEMLVQVLLAGPLLYGQAVAADRCEAADWARRAAAQGSVLGHQQWLFLGRLRQAPDGRDICSPKGG